MTGRNGLQQRIRKTTQEFKQNNQGSRPADGRALVAETATGAELFENVLSEEDEKAL